MELDPIYTIHQLLSNRRHPVSLKTMMSELERGESTVKRAIRKMRDYFCAPIKYDRALNGYYYNHKEQDQPFELPGLWFNTSELYALLAIQTLLENVDQGIYSKPLKLVTQRIKKLLKNTNENPSTLNKKIRIIPIAQRKHNDHSFRNIASAVLKQKQLSFNFSSRKDNTKTQRTVSPLRLVHYKHNWYLDAWCHLRDQYRTFSVELITQTKIESKNSKKISEDELNQHFASAYGIFSGAAKNTAILHFNAQQANWVAAEQWHPQQTSQWLTNGKYELLIPYNNPTELIMDILKYGADVEVIQPKALRQTIKQKIKEMTEKYQ